MNVLTQEQIDSAVQNVLPSVLQGLRTEIQENALRSARDAATKAINEAVTQWVVREIVPEIHSTLAQERDGLVAVVPTLAGKVVETLAQALADELKKNLEQSWDRKKIFEALFQ